MGKSGPSSYQGPTRRMGPTFFGLVDMGPLGSSMGLFGLAEPYFIFYPLQLPPFTPFDPSPLCKRSIGVRVRTNNNDGPYSWG